MNTKTTYPKYHQDFNYAEKLFESIIKHHKNNWHKTWQLIAWDETVTVDFQYFTEYKGWPGKGYRVKFPTDQAYSEKNTRVSPEHEIINYLSQFRLVGDDGSNE